MALTHKALLGGAALAGLFATLAWLERRRPLREPTQPARPRWIRNAATGLAAAAVVGALETPVTGRVAREIERRQTGLAPRLIPRRWQRAAALLMLDYSLYHWHVLLHRVPLLWRWHRWHHADADLDVSTALRFHAMEMAWSLPWRLAQIVLIGAGPRTMALWAKLTLAEVMFHHSNVRLPHRVEQWLGWIIVTPRMHGIHHANDARLQHSNLSSGLSIWDHLHGTAMSGVPQRSITIGLPVSNEQPRACG